MKPTLHTRREFLRQSIGLVSVAWTVPTFLDRTVLALENPVTGTPAVWTGAEPILVVIQLSGGNDSLNTIVPYGDDLYYKARPDIGIPANQALKINDTFGFHPQCAKFKELFDGGRMAILHGVGYPNPNRSHFRSMEIWHTASDSNRHETHGWIGRYFDHACKGCDPATAINIGKLTPQAFSGPTPFGMSIEDPEMYRWMNTSGTSEAAMKKADSFFRKLNDGKQPAALSSPKMGQEMMEAGSVDYLQRTALNAQLSSDKVRDVVKKYRSTVTYPDTDIAYGLKLVAQMIAGNMPTRVYYVSQGGYDTHANQLADQAELLGDLSSAVAAFYQDLEQQRNIDRVLSFAFSEFGRRVAENASGGTDHGSGGGILVFGSRIKPGFHGQHPSLASLLNGDLKHSVDFRSVYATVLEKWLKAKSEPILGRAFPKLEFV